MSETTELERTVADLARKVEALREQQADAVRLHDLMDQRIGRVETAQRIVDEREIGRQERDRGWIEDGIDNRGLGRRLAAQEAADRDRAAISAEWERNRSRATWAIGVSGGLLVLGKALAALWPWASKP